MRKDHTWIQSTPHLSTSFHPAATNCLVEAATSRLLDSWFARLTNMHITKIIQKEYENEREREIVSPSSNAIFHHQNDTYSHAETTLAGRRNVLIFGDFRIIQSSIEHGCSSTRQEKSGFGFRLDDLVRGHGAEESCSYSNQESKKKRGD